jgi:hypothetical protein
MQPTPACRAAPAGRAAIDPAPPGREDEIEALERLDGDVFADRLRVGYRFAVTNPDGRFLVEQQAYLTERDGRIGWMRVLCSGFRAAPSPG